MSPARHRRCSGCLLAALVVACGPEPTAEPGGTLDATLDATADALADAADDVTTVPAIVFEPTTLNLRAQVLAAPAIGEFRIVNPRAEPLSISHLGLAYGASDSFSLSLRDAAGSGTAPLPMPGVPLTIPGYGRVTLAVAFAPARVGAETTAVEVVSSAKAPLVAVHVTANAVEQLCPTAVIAADKGFNVPQGTPIGLNGLGSTAWGASVSAWRWTMTPPANAPMPLFSPSAHATTPTVTLQAPGLYVVQLEVRDSFGVVSCEPATRTFACGDSNDLDIRLTWETAGDTDASDTKGSDLDLHFVDDDLAPWYDDVDGDGQADPWYSPNYDCFWYHPKPAWGSFDPSVDDDPSLDDDDTDGFGPETISLPLAQHGARYRVRVEYAHEHGFGPSKAKVVISLLGVVMYEAEHVLTEGCLWDVATVAWPSGAVIPTKAPNGIGPRVTCPYVNVLFKP